MLVRRAFPAARQRFAHPFQFLRSVPGRKFDRRADEGMYHRTSTESRGLDPAYRTEMKLTMAEAEKAHSYKKGDSFDEASGRHGGRRALLVQAAGRQVFDTGFAL